MAVPTVPVAPGRDHHRPAGDRAPAGIDAASAPGAGSLATGSIFNRRFGASACKPRIACSTWNTLPAGQALGTLAAEYCTGKVPGASLDPTVERGQSMAHEIARRLGDIAGNATFQVKYTESPQQRDEFVQTHDERRRADSPVTFSNPRWAPERINCARASTSRASKPIGSWPCVDFAPTESAS
jgi:hypothetical protein